MSVLIEPWRYEELRAPAPLAAHVAAFWQMRGGCAPLRHGLSHRILPDGCVDLLIDLRGGSGQRIIGTMTRAVQMPLHGAIDVLGVRFRPAAAACWIRLPIDALTDAEASAADCELALGAALPHALAAAGSLAARAQLLGEWLLGHVRTPQPDAAIGPALAALSRDAIPVATLAARLGIGERRLERRFRALVGLTPAAYRRIARFRRLLALLECPGGTLADAALAAGYYDQPHLDREFRRLAGCTPREWLRTRVGFVQDGRLAVL